jgi:hypothetical protein
LPDKSEARDLIDKGSGSVSLCLLVFGSLGTSAETSLASIYQKFERERICVCADDSGREWILKNTPEAKIASLCFHNPDKSALKLLGLDTTEVNHYSEFGNERFVKLTTFKWQLLRDSLCEHTKTSGVLFTDLDVIWFQNPFEKTFEFKSGKILAQDDTPEDSKAIHLCSGIMFFPNKVTSLDLLNKLFTKQLSENAIGNLTPDEPTLNNWFRAIGQDSNLLTVFATDQYIIGHRFFHFLLRRSAHSGKEICFHLNYVVGEVRKNRRAKAILSRRNKGLNWIFLLAVELLLQSFARVRFK